MHLVIAAILVLLTAVNVHAQPKRGNAGAESTGAAHKILTLTNIQRVQNGLPILRIDQRCVAAITRHVDEMAREEFLSHVGRDGRGANERYRQYNPTSRGAGENIAYNLSGTGDSFMRQWLNSSGHRSNILNSSYKGIGVAVRAKCSRGNGGKCYYYAGQCFSN